jgi:arylsulfatase A-like enzyme
MATSAHIQDYQLLYGASEKVLRDPSAGFVLLHLPIPHPWGIYNRRTGNFSTSTTSYIDNLALADKCLAGMRTTLQQTGQWDSSTVVVMGDHSWRTMIWRSPAYLDAWTPEDESASHGG